MRLWVEISDTLQRQAMTVRERTAQAVIAQGLEALVRLRRKKSVLGTSGKVRRIGVLQQCRTNRRKD